MLFGVVLRTYSTLYVAKNIVLFLGLDRSDKPKARATHEFADIDACTLQEARITMEERFAALSKAEVWEPSELAKLLGAARTLAGQADSLSAMMLDRNVAGASIAIVEDLRAGFKDLANRILGEIGIRKQ